MIILDGKKLNNEIASELKTEIVSFGQQKPKLVIIQIGDNAASNVYVGRKVKFAETIGALCEVKKFPETIMTEDIISEIEKLSDDQATHGIIVQLPIPAQCDFHKIVNAIKPEKDVDGLSAVNIHKLVRNDQSGMVPATARGIVTLLTKNDIELKGKKVLVIGRSLLVGKSTALHFLNQDATVTVAHSASQNLIEHIRAADIIVVATGKPGLINKEMLSSDREDQVIVDVGITVLEDGSISGDVHMDEDAKIAAISKVPGGVGPMTVASLFQNLIESFKKTL